MGDALADTVIARHRRRRRRLITIDLDVTEDQTHGAQQLTFGSSSERPYAMGREASDQKQGAERRRSRIGAASGNRGRPNIGA
jgi:hypothetical protein